MQKKAEICVRVSAGPTMANTVSAHNKVLAKTEQALSVWSEDMSQKHVPDGGKLMHKKASSLCEHRGYGRGSRRVRGRKCRMVGVGWLAL